MGGDIVFQFFNRHHWQVNRFCGLAWRFKFIRIEHGILLKGCVSWMSDLCHSSDQKSSGEYEGRKVMPQTIVLVDDDRNILTSVQMTLEAEGFTVRTYPDGDEALRGLTQHPPDLAVLDIKMPRLNGMELIQKLKQNSATTKLPVIFLTSKDEEIDEIMGLRMGADDYIRKPFSQRLLIERIRSLLRREQARQQPVNSDPTNIMTRGNLILDMACH